MDFHHIPVMVDRIVDLFAPVPPGWVVDATVGGAGHATALLEAHAHLSLLGLDRDPFAVDVAEERLGRFGDRARVVHATFDALGAIVDDAGIDVLSGALLDLGVSSPQLDTAERGFSYRQGGPLDMRMDPTQATTAADLVNELPTADLSRILSELGDERFATRIARAIVAARPLTNTTELAEVVRNAIPAPARRRAGGDPARRTFQALRIAVNAELDRIRPAMEEAIDRLTPLGRLAVLAYHSGEDRIVKDTLITHETGGCTCPPGLPCVCGAVPTIRRLRPGTWKSQATDIEANPRAEAARLRAAERLAPEVLA